MVSFWRVCTCQAGYTGSTYTATKSDSNIPSSRPSINLICPTTISTHHIPDHLDRLNGYIFTIYVIRIILTTQRGNDRPLPSPPITRFTLRPDPGRTGYELRYEPL